MSDEIEEKGSTVIHITQETRKSETKNNNDNPENDYNLIMPITDRSQIYFPPPHLCGSFKHITTCCCLWLFIGPFLLIGLIFYILFAVLTAMLRKICPCCFSKLRESYLTDTKLKQNIDATNWQQTVPFSPSRITHVPTKEEELCAIVRDHKKVRVLGAGHSLLDHWSTSTAQDGCALVSLVKYNKILKIEKEKFLVTFQSGAHLWQLNDILRSQNLALPYMGTTAYQTFIGAMSTGTHPGALRFSTFANLVENFRLITSEGEILEVNRQSEYFPALGVSLGLLGIISTVTIRVVPAFAMNRLTRFVSFDYLIQDWDKLQNNDIYGRHLWYPFVDRVQLVFQNHVEKKNPSSSFSYAESGISLVFSQLLLDYFSYIRSTPIHRCLQATVVMTKLPTLNASGASDRMLNVDMNHHSSHFRALNMEVALPYKYSVQILKDLREFFQKFQLDVTPDLPIGIRIAKADNFWLSPAYYQPSSDLSIENKEKSILTESEHYMWLDFFVPIYSKNSSTEKGPAKFFDQIYEILKPYQPRCHWGKNICNLNSTNISQLFPKYSEFNTLREKLDPKEKFLNPWLKQFFKNDEKLILKPSDYYSNREFSEMSYNCCVGCIYTSPCTTCCFPSPFQLNQRQIDEQMMV